MENPEIELDLNEEFECFDYLEDLLDELIKKDDEDEKIF